MKIAYNNISTVIEMKPDRVTGLVIENSEMLFKFLTDLKASLRGEERGFVFSRNNMPFNPSQEVKLLTDFIDFELNQKSLLSKIIKSTEINAVNEDFFMESQHLLSEIENYLRRLTLDFPGELFFDKLSVQSLIKSFGLSLIDDYDSLEEKLLEYMELAYEFEGIRLFILVNVRCLIPQPKLQELIDTALINEHKILLVDCREYPRLNQEDRLIIDEDLCEI